jgi:hypothetical protein
MPLMLLFNRGSSCQNAFFADLCDSARDKGFGCCPLTNSNPDYPDNLPEAGESCQNAISASSSFKEGKLQLWLKGAAKRPECEA